MLISPRPRRRSAAGMVNPLLPPDGAPHVTEATQDRTGLSSTFGIDRQGIRNVAAAHWNLSVPMLYEHAIRRGEGVLGEGGSFVARTGIHTGRSVKDKFIVEEPGSKADIWWNSFNQPASAAVFESMHQRMLAYLQGREIFVQDVFCGADPEFRLPVRLISESAWHTLFARNMFIRPSPSDLRDFQPGFTILHAPRLHATPERDGLNSETFILVNFAEKLALIGGTSYAGEVKK